MKKELFLQLLRQTRENCDMLNEAAKDNNLKVVEDMLLATKWSLYSITSYVNEIFNENEEA